MSYKMGDGDKTATRIQDMDTQMTSGRSETAQDEPSVPGLTILAHPDRRRVGDRLALPVLAAPGREVRLSRLEPKFSRAGRTTARSLAVAHVSRQPVRLTGGADPGSVVVDRRHARTPVIAAGEAIEELRAFSAGEVERGVVLTLGHRIVLLLHLMTTRQVVETEDFGLVGESQAIAQVRQDIRRVADLDFPVLVRGETGTGKELVARAVHDAGKRARGPFVAVNMGALPPSLAASELFGATKGAFTGAERAKVGLFRKAHHGTLLLDEIGEAPPEIQVMLLRTLETGEVLPVGGTEPLAVDVRVVAATDQDLESAMAEGSFREPLYHRLVGYAIQLPPLRQHRGDIGQLLYHFLEQETLRSDASSEPPVGDKPWPPAALVAKLADFDWPGNVRQLRNVARWLAVASREDTAGSLPHGLEKLLNEEKTTVSSQLPAVSNKKTPVSTSQSPPLTSVPVAANTKPPRLYRAPRNVDDDELLTALRANGWRLKPTAIQLGVSRTSLYALIDRCPQIRRAADLSRDELEACLARHQGDPEAAAIELEVSPHGLVHRLRELGFEGS